MILDDHEVFNDFVGRISIQDDPEAVDRMNQAFTAYSAYQRRDLVRHRDDDYWYTFQVRFPSSSTRRRRRGE